VIVFEQDLLPQNHQHSASIDKHGLFRELRAQFKLDWRGIHGAPHWARVRYRGLALANITGADGLVVELFAFLHDTKRHNEMHDPWHGLRAADYAASLNGRYFALNNQQMDALHMAISAHSAGSMNDTLTIQTCWDADRLDLGRVGICPDRRFLSVDAQALFTAQLAGYGRGTVLANAK
jgi:uncharacterized protein